jgi:hypothetical protein
MRADAQGQPWGTGKREQGVETLMDQPRQCCNPQMDTAAKQHFATNQPDRCEKLDDPRN